MRRLVLCLLPLAALAQGGALFDDAAPAEDSDPAPSPFSEWDGVTQLCTSGDGVGADAPPPSLSLVGEYALPDSAPEGLSGIAWRGGVPGGAGSPNDDYVLVEDSGGRLHSATIGIDRCTGKVTNAVVSPSGAIPGASDLEGIACGRAGSTPMLFVSDEGVPAILAKEVGASGSDWTALSLPEPLRRCRFNLALEALSLSADGHILWTANEDALPEDGPVATTQHGSLVRLYAMDVSDLRRPPAEPRWWSYPLDATAGAPFPHLPAPFNGLAALCALPDGRLLALERSFGLRTRSADDPRASLITISIYLVDPLHAEAERHAESKPHAESAESKPHAESAEFAESKPHAEFAEFAESKPHAEFAEFAESKPHAESAESKPHAESAEFAEFAESKPHAESAEFAERPPVLAKTLLWRGLTGRANYEGMALGPALSDGSRALILVSDGDVTRKGAFAFPWSKRLLSFRLRLPDAEP